MEKFVNIIAVYMIVNFRIYRINQDAHKLIRTLILKKKKKKITRKKSQCHCSIILYIGGIKHPCWKNIMMSVFEILL